MIKRLVRLSLRLALVGVGLWAVRAGLKRWIDGPDIPVSNEPWPPIPSGPSVVKPRGVVERPPTPAVTPVAKLKQPAKEDPPRAKSSPPRQAAPERSEEVAPAEPAKQVLKAKAVKKAAAGRAADGAGASAGWVAPGPDGSAPASHPVKAKMSSKIYHLPGMAFYDRTVPDRCYASPEEAEADGFSRAKR